MEFKCNICKGAGALKFLCKPKWFVHLECIRSYMDANFTTAGATMLTKEDYSWMCGSWAPPFESTSPVIPNSLEDDSGYSPPDYDSVEDSPPYTGYSSISSPSWSPGSVTWDSVRSDELCRSPSEDLCSFCCESDEAEDERTFTLVTCGHKWHLKCLELYSLEKKELNNTQSAQCWCGAAF